MGATFYLGTLAIHWYGLFIALAVVAAISITIIEAKRRGQPTGQVFSLALIVIPLGAIGARLYHVIDDWQFYSQNPALILGGRGLGIFGAIIGGAIGLIVYTQCRKLGTLRWLAITASGLLLAQDIGRWGNFFNQELYGYPTDV
jgi:phosphatidylglycerol:prolipoprotein diacylglycerol transferase